MKTQIRILSVLLVCIAAPLQAEWERLAPGVEFQKFRRKEANYYVSRIDLTNDRIRVVGTQERDRGTMVSTYSRQTKSIVAVNGDYFDEKLQPIGQSVSRCGPWKKSGDLSRPVIAVGKERSGIYRPSELDDPTPRWAETVVSGWPRLVIDCKALSSTELPGSDRFTRTALARTAVGLTDDQDTMFLVVVEKREAISNGATLADLATFMKDELAACSAVNLDGGGSAAMAVEGKLVNEVTYGDERRVANHLAVVLAKDVEACGSARATADSRMTDREFWNDVREVIGSDGALSERVLRFTWPRSDLLVMSRGITLDPAFAQTSWAAFRRMEFDVFVTGELIVLESEAAAVTAALKENKIGFSSARHALVQTSPRLVSVHFQGKGALAKVAHGIREALEATTTPLKPTGNGSSRKVGFDTKKLDAEIGRAGSTSGPVYQFTIPRQEKITIDGTEITAPFGAASTFRLQSVANGHAIATGEFALLESEVGRVVSALREGGMTAGAAHSHFSSIQPRLVFVEFWGDEDAATVAAALRNALDVITSRQ